MLYRCVFARLIGMYYAGEAVRSRYDGLGLIVETGDDPVVTFLDGFRRREDGATLTIVPGELYDAEYVNRLMIERWLDLRIHGRPYRRQPLVPRERYDLVIAMRRAAAGLTARITECLSSPV